MAKQVINLGTNPNDLTGDDLRSGGIKINDNFTELYAGKQAYHGFVNLTDSSLPNDVATSAGTFVFTLTKVNNFTVYIDGIAIVKTASLSIDLMLQSDWGNGTTNPIGQWFIWFKADGTLAASKTAWNILDTTITPVAILWVQSTGGSNFEGIVSEERHNYKRNLIEHKNQHDSWGAQYVSGFTGLTCGTGVASNGTNTFSLVGGTIRDEELYAIISNPQTQCRIGYKDGANAWMKFDAAGTGYCVLNGVIPRYDNAGVLTDIPNTNYGVYWVYATNRKVTPIVIIMGQSQYSTIALAQAAPQPTLYGFNVAEWKLLYRIIVRRTGGGGGSLAWIQNDALYNLSLGVAVSSGAIAAATAGNTSYSPTASNPSTNVQTAIEKIEDDSLINPLVSKTLTAGYGRYIPDSLEISDGIPYEIEDTAVLEIG